jgi:hypothetical protein
MGNIHGVLSKSRCKCEYWHNGLTDIIITSAVSSFQIYQKWTQTHGCKCHPTNQWTVHGKMDELFRSLVCIFKFSVCHEHGCLFSGIRRRVVYLCIKKIIEQSFVTMRAIRALAHGYRLNSGLYSKGGQLGICARATNRLRRLQWRRSAIPKPPSIWHPRVPRALPLPIRFEQHRSPAWQ